uniref:Uncharacterized protein n=1 Tax=Esox lucius TaxID=8010 RepID=A0A6Q2Y7Q1_ESOLU
SELGPVVINILCTVTSVCCYFQPGSSWKRDFDLNVANLRGVRKKEWCNITLHTDQNLHDSIPRRTGAVLKGRRINKCITDTRFSGS